VDADVADVCSPSVSIEWMRRDGAALTSSSSVVDYGRRLYLSQVNAADSGQYVCRASNKIGDATATVLLTVDGIKHHHITLYLLTLSVSSINE